MKSRENQREVIHNFPQNLFLVRHGQTTANANGKLDRNPQLTGAGATQALEIGVALENECPVAIIHTGLDRTGDTAKLIQLGGGFGNVPLVEMGVFKERDMGIYDGDDAVKKLRAVEGMEAIYQRYGASFVWFAEGTKHDGVEPLEAMEKRIREGLKELTMRFGNKPIILVAHEGSIKIIQLISEGFGGDAHLLADPKRHIANGEIQRPRKRRSR